MADDPRALAPVAPALPAVPGETNDEREVRYLTAKVKQKAIRQAAKVLDAVDDATLLADVAEPRKTLPTRTAFALEVARGALAMESAQAGTTINISQTIVLPPQQEPDYSDAITVEPTRGDE